MKNPFEMGVSVWHGVRSITTDSVASDVWLIVEDQLWSMTATKFRESARTIGSEIVPIIRALAEDDFWAVVLGVRITEIHHEQ